MNATTNQNLLDRHAHALAQKSGLAGPARAEAEQEIRSHLYEAARVLAASNGRNAPDATDYLSITQRFGLPQAETSFFAPRRLQPATTAFSRPELYLAIPCILIGTFTYPGAGPAAWLAPLIGPLAASVWYAGPSKTRRTVVAVMGFLLAWLWIAVSMFKEFAARQQDTLKDESGWGGIILLFLAGLAILLFPVVLVVTILLSRWVSRVRAKTDILAPKPLWFGIVAGVVWILPNVAYRLSGRGFFVTVGEYAIVLAILVGVIIILSARRGAGPSPMQATGFAYTAGLGAVLSTFGFLSLAGYWLPRWLN